LRTVAPAAAFFGGSTWERRARRRESSTFDAPPGQPINTAAGFGQGREFAPGEEAELIVKEAAVR
jgi:hypothetical protein